MKATWIQNILPATLAGLLLMPALSLGGSDIVSDAAPPPPRVEHQPPRRDGYVWASGYWEKYGGSFHWVAGTWINERRGVHWVSDHWDQVESEWHYVRGHWEP
jgi:hypothetical protein